MTSKESAYQKICQKTNYSLHVLCDENGIRLRVTLIVSMLESTQYDMTISSLKDYEVLATHCESF